MTLVKSMMAVIASTHIIFAFAISNTAAEKPIIGDVDGDNAITASDARLALRASVKLETLSTAQMKAANVDKVEGVSASDARLILRVAVKLDSFE